MFCMDIKVGVINWYSSHVSILNIHVTLMLSRKISNDGHCSHPKLPFLLVLHSLYLQVPTSSNHGGLWRTGRIAIFMYSWTMLLIMRSNGEFLAIMPCDPPKSHYGSHQLCGANWKGQVSWWKSGASYYMQSINIFYPHNIVADDGQLQSILHIDITEGNYCKRFGHGPYTEYKSCGRQTMRRQCPEPTWTRSLPITATRHMCNW